MKRNGLWCATPWMAVLALAAGTAACGGGDDDSAASNPPPDNNPPASRTMTAEACTALAAKVGALVNHAQGVTTTWQTTKTAVSGGAVLPAYCEVDGTIDPRTGSDGVSYGIMFQLNLPAEWNGRFFFQGGGGTDGSVSPAYGTINSADGGANVALTQGYAVVSTDGGHENSVLAAKGLTTAAFGADDQARIDWGYTAIDKTATTAKAVIESVYGSQPDHSYFLGCSNGGRQGMVFTQRFPDYFDGVVAGDPVMDLGSITAAEMWGMQQIGAISPVDGGGKPLYYQSFSDADRRLFINGYLQACDADDGVADGMVQNPGACHFDPAVLQCSGAKADTCLSAAQVAAVRAIVGGPVDSSGAPIKVPGYLQAGETAVAGYPLDAGWFSPAGQPSRLLGSAASAPGDLALGGAQIPYLHLAQPNPAFDPLHIDWDTYPSLMTVDPPWLSTSADLAAFKSHGGKLIFYHGLGDPGPSVANTINYYNRVATLNGGYAQTQQFARLFLVPGMGHCSGGPATDSFDQLTAIVNWVEKGVPPDTITARSRSNNTALNAVTPAIPPNRARPLCPYPASAAYQAGGDKEKAESFACK